MIERIAGYEVIGEVGRGAMATVYRARALAAGAGPQEVAIKVLRREYLTDLGFRARFEREARTIAALEHAAIVPVYSFGQFEEQLYIVMAYMPHGSLAQRLLRGPLLPEAAMDILSRVGVALDYAHSRGIVHRDLKPSNVLFDARDRAYLADFGIAAQLHAVGGDDSTISGTPAYMSPEQARREQRTGPASDLYSLGVLAYQLLVGRLPFRAEMPVAVLMQHMQEQPPAPVALNPALAAGVDAVLLKALAKERGQRYESAATFLAALRHALAGNIVAVPPGVAASVAAEAQPENGGPLEAAAMLPEEGEEAAHEAGQGWRRRLQKRAGGASQGLRAVAQGWLPWLAARRTLAFALVTALAITCALVAVLLVRGPQLAAASRSGRPAGIIAATSDAANPVGDGVAGTVEAEVFLPLTWLEPGRVTPSPTATPVVANVRMEYDTGVITLLNISADHVSLSDVALRRVAEGGPTSPTLGVRTLNRVAGNAVGALPGADCLQLLATEAIRSRGVQKPAACDTMRGWLATSETNQLFEGAQDGDSFEVLLGEQSLAVCALSAGVCEFRVENE